MRFVPILIVAGTALVAPLARASVVVPQSIEQLSQKADAVVRGQVTGQRVESTRTGRLVTVTTIAVAEVFKGSPASQIEVRTQGGISGRIGQQVTGEAHFSADEQVVVFLRSTRLAGGSFAVLGLAQGKFTVSQAEGGTLAVQDLTGLGFAAGAGLPVEDRVATPLPLAELKARVARAVAP